MILAHGVHGGRDLDHLQDLVQDLGHVHDPGPALEAAQGPDPVHAPGQGLSQEKNVRRSLILNQDLDPDLLVLDPSLRKSLSQGPTQGAVAGHQTGKKATADPVHELRMGMLKTISLVGLYVFDQ